MKFRKSSFSGDASCVEVGAHDKNIYVRDSKAPEYGMLKFNAAEWDAFIKGVKAGEFDL